MAKLRVSVAAPPSAVFVLWVSSQKLVAKTLVKEFFPPVFSFRIVWFQVLYLSLIHFELIFVSGMR